MIGEKRPFLAALAVLDTRQWQRAAGDAVALNTAEARRIVLERIRKAVAAFPAYATPRTAWCTVEPWTIENGLITPTLKVKRAAVEERFAAQIEEFYASPRR